MRTKCLNFCVFCYIFKDFFVVFVQKTKNRKLFKTLLTIKKCNAIILSTYRERKNGVTREKQKHSP